MKKVVKLALLVALLWGVGGALAVGVAQERELETYRAGAPAKVGPLTYEVARAWWQNFPVPGREDNVFLGVALSVRNGGTRTVQIPPFGLVDSEGREHGVNYSKIVWPRMSLGPGETERGKLYFHVSRDLSYRLLVSGGYLSNEFAFLGLGKIADGS